MRVISGSAKGRQLKAVQGSGTRPTSDKVKESIFNFIGPYFDGGVALDLFAGTGGLGIEALSRGMDRAVFIDVERRCIDVIKHNLQVTDLLEKAEIYRNEAAKALKVLAKRKLSFDLLFLDPPYNQKYMAAMLEDADQLSLLTEGAIIVIEHAAAYRYPEMMVNFERNKVVVYGDTAVTTYHYTQKMEKGEDIRG